MVQADFVELLPVVAVVAAAGFELVAVAEEEGVDGWVVAAAEPDRLREQVGTLPRLGAVPMVAAVAELVRRSADQDLADCWLTLKQSTQLLYTHAIP